MAYYFRINESENIGSLVKPRLGLPNITATDPDEGKNAVIKFNTSRDTDVEGMCTIPFVVCEFRFYFCLKNKWFGVSNQKSVWSTMFSPFSSLFSVCFLLISCH